MERGARIAGRYRVEARLGRGGMGTVYRVHDESTQRDVALKTMAVEADPSTRRPAALFEREYHALAQLAHPRIIAVYDYGVADGVPYYTMELLDGKDLREVAPLPWKQACALLRDVCSSLALLHSRRIVHRDLTPRNIRCTQDGRAKLIDFGAMSPMGTIDQIVGTPPYMSPEALLGPDVDGRADIFSLGALTYWTLTGRHAHPAKTIADLKTVWRTPPPAPSSVAPEIPRELDELAMTMMSMDPLQRPQTVAEVADRLTGIAGLGPREQADVALAYLRTPALVGRDEDRAHFRKRVQSVERGRGGMLVIEGASGLGRTRLLDTFLLDGRTAGALAVRVSATDIERGPFSLWRALGRLVLQHEPEIARRAAEPHRAALAHVLPEVLGRTQRGTLEGFDPSGDRTQRALCDWLLSIARSRCLIVGIDDLEQGDDASLAALARLAHEAREHPVVLVATTQAREGVEPSRTVDRIVAAGASLSLVPLGPQESRALVGSVFGAVPNLEVVASWIDGVARGNPGRTMDLAQFLVDRGIARFTDEGWTLPEQLRDQDLPGGMEEAMTVRLAALSEPAMRLARLLALVTPHGPLALGDYHELLSDRFETSAIFAALEDLTRAQIVVRQGHALRGDAWRRVVLRTMDDETRRALHRELAVFYERHRGEKLLQAHHLAQGGRWAEAIDAMIEIERDAVITDVASPGAVFARSTFGVELMERAIDEGARLGHPKSLAVMLRRSLLGVAASARPDLVRHASPQLEQLRHDSGLAYLDETDPRLPMAERVGACLMRAQAAYDATPPAARGFRPERAIREIALLSSLLTGIYVRVLESERILGLPNLIAPLAPLAAAADVLHRVALVTCQAMVRGADLGDQRLALRAALCKPIEGVDDVLRQGVYHVFSFYCGVECATQGDPRALAIADDLPAIGTHAALPWQVRKLYYQCIGARERMEECRREMELLSIGHIEAETHLTVSLIYELGVAATAADLMEVKRLLHVFEREAVLYPGWKPVERLAAALYDLLRQDLDAAEHAAREGLDLVRPLGHFAWFPLRTCLVDVLRRTGRATEALRVGAETVAAYRREGLAPPTGPFPSIEIAMAFAEQAVDLPDEARTRLDALIAVLEGHVAGFVPCGVAHEERARLALAQGDRAALERHAGRAGDIYRASGAASLAQRHAALVTEARHLDPDYRSGSTELENDDEATFKLDSDRAVLRARR